MSNYSDSIHIYNTNICSITNILKELDIQAVLLGTFNNTISLIMSWEDKEKIIPYFNFIDYSYGEDHGLWLRFYNKKETARIEISWDDPEIMGIPEEEWPVITPHWDEHLIENQFISHKHISELKNLIDKLKISKGNKTDLINRIAHILGFRHYENYSYSFFLSEPVDFFSCFPKAKLIP